MKVIINSRSWGLANDNRFLFVTGSAPPAKRLNLPWLNRKVRFGPIGVFAGDFARRHRFADPAAVSDEDSGKKTVVSRSCGQVQNRRRILDTTLSPRPKSRPQVPEPSTKSHAHAASSGIPGVTERTSGTVAPISRSQRARPSALSTRAPAFRCRERSGAGRPAVARSAAASANGRSTAPRSQVGTRHLPPGRGNRTRCRVPASRPAGNNTPNKNKTAS